MRQVLALILLSPFLVCDPQPGVGSPRSSSRAVGGRGSGRGGRLDTARPGGRSAGAVLHAESKSLHGALGVLRLVGPFRVHATKHGYTGKHTAWEVRVWEVD